MKFNVPLTRHRGAPLLAACLAFAVSACASSETARQANDPFEPLNRDIYQFNESLDDLLIEPAARVYVGITPKPARTGVRNFMDNLNQPVVFANTLLQGDLKASAETAGRFVVNTVFGLAGFVDIASREGIPQHREDFGQTLAAWGVQEGPFIMLPVLGPSNLRDGIGLVADRYPHPLQWNEDYSQSEWAWGLRGLNGIDRRARSQDAISSLEAAAIDPYVQIRSAYRQARERAIANGQDSTFENLPDFD